MKYSLVILLALSFSEVNATVENITSYNTNTVSPNTTISDSTVQYAMVAILHYLEARPGSAETLEGIHNFWIVWPSIPESIEVTQIALLQLEQLGHVRKIKLPNKVLWMGVRF